MRGPSGGRIKVLHVCTIPLTARAFIAPLARHLEARGFEVTIACADESEAESGPAMEEMRREGLRMKAIPIPRAIRPWADARALWTLTAFIRAERFAIVHTQTAKAGFIGRCAARLARVPVVIHTAHAFPFHPYLPPTFVRVYAMLERWAAGWTDLIMVDTEAVRSDGLRHRIPPAKMLTVHMGIDLRRFSPADADGGSARREWGIPPDEPVVGAVARLVPDKGLDGFLDAAARVAGQRPRVRFLIVGGGPLHASLARRARTLGIADRVIFAGVRSDIPRQLAAMDLFVLPTRREGFGVAFAEAMSMGKPVVGSDIGPIREVVVDGETGLLVPPDDPERLAQAIITLLADEPRRRAMGAAGRRRVEALFDEQTMCERTEAEYRRLLKEKGWPHERG